MPSIIHKIAESASLFHALPAAKLTDSGAIQQAAFTKDGLERFRHPQYQYECLGLGGTVLRVGPDGFTL